MATDVAVIGPSGKSQRLTACDRRRSERTRAPDEWVTIDLQREYSVKAIQVFADRPMPVELRALTVDQEYYVAH